MNLLTKMALVGLLCTCRQTAPNPYPSIGSIPVPAGYHRLPSAPFTTWLRMVRLKKDKTVYLYDGSPKRYQDAQFAVLEISVGHQDLQQCADAVMRLRAEYLYSLHDYAAIDFTTDQGTHFNFKRWLDGDRWRLDGNRLTPWHTRPPDPADTIALRHAFDDYLLTVFTYCGTHSLERQLLPAGYTRIQPGDVLIKGGSPGHAMLVVDVAEDAQGRRLYLLAQSYMPAQDIHIVVNPGDPGLSPWYLADSSQQTIETPEWTFKTNQLRAWPPRHAAL